MVFPNPTEPGCGIFVQRRLEHLAALPGGPEVRVLAPVQIFDYANRAKRFLRARGVVRRRMQGPVTVYHDKWFYPPFAGVFNALFLAAQMLPRCIALRLEGYRFDALDAHFGHPEGVAAALLAMLFRCPFYITMRGNESIHAERALRRWSQTWAYRRAAGVIAVSEPLREFAVSLGVRPERAVTIPNGVDGAVFYRRGHGECRARHRIAADAKVILSAGYLVEGKGHHHVIEALAALNRRGVEAELIIAGGAGREGDFEPVIREAVRRHGVEARVRMVGAVQPETLAELMCAADVLCLASYAEGWPNVVHEALACGTPVVATRVGGVPEMIRSADQGIVIPPRDQAALESALETALGRSWDPAAVSEWARSRTWENVAREVWEAMSSPVCSWAL